MPSQTKAVIWDMDGVIVDSGPSHFRSWQYVFAKRGVDFTGEDFQRRFGQRNDTIIKGALGKDISLEEIEAIAVEKESYYRETVKQNIKPFPGAIELIKSLHARDFSIALASSAPPENIQLILEKLGIKDYFQAIVFGREVTEGKPSPQCFLLAARKLGVEPVNCIVIEDAVAGVSAAKRAGMLCIAVRNTHPDSRLAEADLIVGSLEQVDASYLEKMLNQKNKE